MKLQDQVITIDQAKRLKELGAYEGSIQAHSKRVFLRMRRHGAGITAGRFKNGAVAGS